LTVLKWDKASNAYFPNPVGQLEAHVAVGGQDDWQMYLHGPMLRPKREQGNWSMPPFYVQATFTNKVYRFEQIKKRGNPGQRGQKMDTVSKVVAYALAPSTSYPIEDANGDLEAMLVAEGQPFLVNAPLDPVHDSMNFGGVDYIKDGCTRIFPNKIDTDSNMKRGNVVNTVSCHPHTGICFFSVWKFYDDQAPFWNNITSKEWPDCLHYCVTDSLTDLGAGCKKGGIVVDENGEQICSKHGVGAVHGMTVSTVVNEDPNTFDIFLVMTGGATFVGGESSMRKVACKKTSDGDLAIVKTEVFGRDLFETSVGRTSGTGLAPVDVGGDHAWVDESGKHVWVSTFRMANAGVHMLDYVTGDLIYSVHGTATYAGGGPNNYAYSAGIHGMGSLGTKDGTLVLGTSACTHPKSACFPVPWDAMTKMAGLEAKGLMYVIDLSEILPPAETTIVV